MNKVLELLTFNNNFTIITKDDKIQCNKHLLVQSSQYIRNFIEQFPDKNEIDLSNIDFVNTYVIEKIIEKLKNPDKFIGVDTWYNVVKFFKFIDFLNIDQKIMSIFDEQCNTMITKYITKRIYNPDEGNAFWYSIFNILGSDTNIHLIKIRKALYEFCKIKCWGILLSRTYGKKNKYLSELTEESISEIEKLLKEDTQIE